MVVAVLSVSIEEMRVIDCDVERESAHVRQFAGATLNAWTSSDEARNEKGAASNEAGAPQRL